MTDCLEDPKSFRSNPAKTGTCSKKLPADDAMTKSVGRGWASYGYFLIFRMEPPTVEVWRLPTALEEAAAAS